MAELGYRYRFRPDELPAIRACKDDHGFAIVEQLLPTAKIEAMQRDVCSVLESSTPPGGTVYSLDFIQYSPALASLLTIPPFMAVASALYDQSMTLNRSAAIFKRPGAAAGPWHTDWQALDPAAPTNDAVLNTTGACSMWFYLNGTHPSRAGLAIVPDSHRADWPGPAGFFLTAGRNTFHRTGTPAEAYALMDFPEAFPILSDPGDLIIFAERTYHGVFPHGGTEPRLSCAISFRPGRGYPPAAWPPSQPTRDWIAAQPAATRDVLEYYMGMPW
ncbi:MAG TPA: phytanoyl-CoA dioxygenase family protein [Tepidisphaeraceae bacterium]|jgi:ectoine hydroxylase-related dioxygenase (phytanoyl-CoA dioxygenase family)